MAFKWDGILDLGNTFIGYTASGEFSRDLLFNLECDNVDIKTWLYKDKNDLEGVPLPKHMIAVDKWFEIEDAVVQQGFDEYARQIDDSKHDNY